MCAQKTREKPNLAYIKTLRLESRLYLRSQNGHKRTIFYFVGGVILCTTIRKVEILPWFFLFMLLVNGIKI